MAKKKGKKAVKPPAKNNKTPHAEHPKCPDCGKSLYKWMGKPVSKGGKNGTGLAEKPPKPSDPYAWCRNSLCEKHGKDQSKSTVVVETKKEVEPESTELKPTPERCPRKKHHKPGTVCAVCNLNTPAETPAGEPAVVTKARERIRKAVTSGGEYSQNVIGLALTIVAQEMGGHDIANQLIDEYDLNKLFGIQKVAS